MKIKQFTSLCLFLFLISSCVTEIEEENEANPSVEKRQLKQEQNLLINGNCENWTTINKPSLLNGWSLHNYNYTFLEYNTVYEGKYSVKLSTQFKGKTATLSQRVEVVPGHRIRIAHHYLIEESTGNSARMYCYFQTTLNRNIPNDILKNYFDAKTIKIIRGGGYGMTSFPIETNQWKAFDYSITVPPTAHYFVFEIHSYYGTTIYIDNCFVVDEDVYK